ncbi:MAG TPA: HNH endonuclease [Thermodesulfovibrionia bacterium]|nr:HNH endonuclease [Thermodesulfovibrionia bacterium]
MAIIRPKTIGQSLFWAYSNFSMMVASLSHEEQEYQQSDYIIRNRMYYGLLRGKLQIASLVKDEKFKMRTSDRCCYCGETNNLSLEHLIPLKRGGTHDPANLIMACRSCNSSKGVMDYLEWIMIKKNEFPHLGILRRYFKITIDFCVQHDLMDLPLDSIATIDPPLPFAIELISDLTLVIQQIGRDEKVHQTEDDSQLTLFGDMNL